MSKSTHLFANAAKASSEPVCDDQQTQAWLRFTRDRRWSLSQKHKLLAYFGSPEALYSLPVAQLRKMTLGPWRNQEHHISRAEIAADLAWLEQDDSRMLTFGSSDYPPQLNNLPDPPISLFVQGDHRLLHDPAVAMVGSRHPTPAGKRMAEQIASGLARAGVVVVSGMALGIDGSSHQATLDAQGATVAVMGCGLDTIYPPRHRGLFKDIAERGCVVTEYPLGVPVSRYTFPQRNRLVAGLSLGTIIIEAAEKSGTLITARLATEQNRALMVVPGSPLSRQYRGSHTLLQQGAALVTSAQDVLAELQLPLRAALNAAVTEQEAPAPRENAQKADHFALLPYIYHESSSVDSIISASGLTAAQVSSMLLILEVEGLIGLASDGGYVKLINEG